MRAPVLPRLVAGRLRLLSYAVFAILLAVAGLVAAATLPVLFGYHTYMVVGGSMEPSLKNGSVAVAKATSSFTLEVGDVIARRESQDGPAVLHRIVRITDDATGRSLYTQGDANRTADPEPVMLLGTGDKVIYSVPYAGYILNFGGSTLGQILLIGVPLVLLAASTLYERVSPRGGRQQPESLQPSAEPSLSERASPRGGPQQPESLRPSAETPGASGGLTLVPRSRSFQPVGKPTNITLVDLSDFRALMKAVGTLSDFPAAQHASIIAFKDGTAVLEVGLRFPLPADEIVDELQGGTGYQIVIEEVQPDVQRLRLRFVKPASRQLERAA